MANILLFRNEPETAQELVATIALNTLNNIELCKINILKTQILLQQNNTDAAMQTGIDAEKLAIESKVNYLQAISLLNNGQVKLATKQTSIEYFQQAAIIFNQNNNQYAVAKTQLCIAESYELLQNQSLANESRQKAHHILDQLYDDGDRLCNLNGVMWIH